MNFYEDGVKESIEHSQMNQKKCKVQSLFSDEDESESEDYDIANES